MANYRTSDNETIMPGFYRTLQLRNNFQIQPVTILPELKMFGFDFCKPDRYFHCSTIRIIKRERKEITNNSLKLIRERVKRIGDEDLVKKEALLKRNVPHVLIYAVLVFFKELRNILFYTQKRFLVLFALRRKHVD